MPQQRSSYMTTYRGGLQQRVKYDGPKFMYNYLLPTTTTQAGSALVMCAELEIVCPKHPAGPADSTNTTLPGGHNVAWLPQPGPSEGLVAQPLDYLHVLLRGPYS